MPEEKKKANKAKPKAKAVAKPKAVAVKPKNDPRVLELEARVEALKSVIDSLSGEVRRLNRVVGVLKGPLLSDGSHGFKLRLQRAEQDSE